MISNLLTGGTVSHVAFRSLPDLVIELSFPDRLRNTRRAEPCLSASLSLRAKGHVVMDGGFLPAAQVTAYYYASQCT